MGFPQLITQMYFNGKQILENDWIQVLNQKDFLLQNAHMTEEQRRHFVVHVVSDSSANRADGLVGQFDITLTK